MCLGGDIVRSRKRGFPQDATAGNGGFAAVRLFYERASHKAVVPHFSYPLQVTAVGMVGAFWSLLRYCSAPFQATYCARRTHPPYA